MSLLLKNIFYLLSSNILVKFLGAISTIFLARYLGAENFGLFSLGLAFSLIAGYFTDLGLTQTLIREGTKRTSSIPHIVSGFLKIKILLIIVSLVISALVIMIVYEDKNIKNVLYYMVLPSIIGGSLQGFGASYFQLIEKMKNTGLIRTISGVLIASSMLIAIILNLSVIQISILYGLASILGGIFSFYLVIREVKITLNTSFKSLLKDLFSYTIGGLLVIATPQIGPIVLEKVASIREVGYFSAAYRIPSVLYQIPQVMATAFYPLLFKLGASKQTHEEHKKISILQIKLMSLLGILISFVFIIIPEFWINLLYGEGWGNAYLNLSILSYVLILQTINFPLADSLTTVGNQRKRTILQLVVFIISIAFYFILGGKFGSFGGAIAALLTEIIYFILLIIFNRNSIMILSKGITSNIMLFIILLIIKYFIFNDQSEVLWLFLTSCIVIFIFLLTQKGVLVKSLQSINKYSERK
jgi:O-antigen/teichoic acid export membrane protein